MREITSDILKEAYGINDVKIFVAPFKKLPQDIREDELSNLTTMEQVHGDKIKIIDSDKLYICGVDGLVSNKCDVTLGVQTADCVPVLIRNENKVAVIHSGWKGTLKNIVGKTLKEFDNAHVFIGPCIRSCCYKINTCEGADNREVDFINKYGKESVSKRNKEVYLDLSGIIKKQIFSSGINNILVFDCQICTCCSLLNLPSHFRDGDKRNEILLSVIRK